MYASPAAARCLNPPRAAPIPLRQVARLKKLRTREDQARLPRESERLLACKTPQRQWAAPPPHSARARARRALCSAVGLDGSGASGGACSSWCSQALLPPRVGQYRNLKFEISKRWRRSASREQVAKIKKQKALIKVRKAKEAAARAAAGPEPEPEPEKPKEMSARPGCSSPQTLGIGKCVTLLSGCFAGGAEFCFLLRRALRSQRIPQVSRERQRSSGPATRALAPASPGAEMMALLGMAPAPARPAPPLRLLLIPYRML